jgi:hypothetical protein
MNSSQTTLFGHHKLKSRELTHLSCERTQSSGVIQRNVSMKTDDSVVESIDNPLVPQRGPKAGPASCGMHSFHRPYVYLKIGKHTNDESTDSACPRGQIQDVWYPCPLYPLIFILIYLPT